MYSPGKLYVLTLCMKISPVRIVSGEPDHVGLEFVKVLREICAAFGFGGFQGM